jgi:hypothetical protein
MNPGCYALLGTQRVADACVIVITQAIPYVHRQGQLRALPGTDLSIEGPSRRRTLTLHSLFEVCVSVYHVHLCRSQYVHAWTVNYCFARVHASIHTMTGHTLPLVYWAALLMVVQMHGHISPT